MDISGLRCAFIIVCCSFKELGVLCQKYTLAAFAIPLDFDAQTKGLKYSGS